MKPLTLLIAVLLTSCVESNPDTARGLAAIQTHPVTNTDSLTIPNKNIILFSDHPIEKAYNNCVSSSANVAQCSQDYFDAWNKAVTDKYNEIYTKANNKTLLQQWHDEYTASQKLYANLLAEYYKDMGQSMFEQRLYDMGKSLKYQYDLLLDIENLVNN